MENSGKKSSFQRDNYELSEDEIEIIEDENEEIYKWLSLSLGFIWILSLLVL
jgi:hypothetical protein